MRVVLCYIFTLLAIITVADASVTLVPFAPEDKTIDDFPFVGRIINIYTGSAGSGTAIGDGSYVLTAKHVVDNDSTSTGLLLEGSNFVFLLNNKSYIVERVYGSPNADLAILKLSEPCTESIYKFYNGLNIGTVFYGVGYGKGCSDPCYMMLDWDIPYGTKRVYKNRFTSMNVETKQVRGREISELYLGFILHDPDSYGLDGGAISGEGMHGFGDSGGGVFVVEKSGIKLVGVICSISNGVIPYFGQIADLQQNKKWIESVTGCKFDDTPEQLDFRYYQFDDASFYQSLLGDQDIFAIISRKRKLFPFKNP